LIENGYSDLPEQKIRKIKPPRGGYQDQECRQVACAR
jgi:hypothetical protein